jgi:hypothetical protein
LYYVQVFVILLAERSLSGVFVHVFVRTSDTRNIPSQ